MPVPEAEKVRPRGQWREAASSCRGTRGGGGSGSRRGPTACRPIDALEQGGRMGKKGVSGLFRRGRAAVAGRKETCF